MLCPGISGRPRPAELKRLGLGWRLSCVLGFTRSAGLSSGGGRVASFVFDRAGSGAHRPAGPTADRYLGDVATTRDRWQLRPDLPARVLELTGPDDWATLVTDHPLARRQRPNSSWELPGPNQDAAYIGDLAAIPGQRALRTTMRYFVEPDWDSVARQWDAIHLNWGAFLLTEGLAIDLDEGDVAMLRSWNSERTLWLNPILGVAGALPAVPFPDGRDHKPPPRHDGPNAAPRTAPGSLRLGRPNSAP